MSQQFHALRVVAVEAETPSTASVRFDVPPVLSGAFRWRPGQHVTLRLTINSREVRRTYSISEAPLAGAALRITVKRVPDGLVSNHINDHVAAGDRIDVAPPFGGFCLDPEPRARRTYYFFAAGSGITPVYAMVRALLEAEPYSVAHLAYGNVDGASIIFREALARAEAGAGGRLLVRHVLSKPGTWPSMDYWRRGRIDAAAVEAFLAEHPPEAQDARYYVCGPGGMNAGVRTALENLDVPAARILMESYGRSRAARDMSVAGVAALVRVVLAGRTLAVPVAPGRTLLDAVRAAGASPPFSCESGVCGSCQARLSAGTVHMRARMALGDDEIAAGAILTCQAVPTTPQLAVSYD